MKKTLLENVISFLLGIFWALLILSAFFFFQSFINLGFLPALVAVILSSVFWLLFIVFLEIANIQVEKIKELKKQTRILESIKHKINE
ncbi:hypothetical protein [Nitrosophilus kaiyonis]|uniref:hypothetical protein n=1 Tax=Nitrosophilus kaiyonis TaxID=2930200 RepID=UPI0024915FC7|nr:hypothetical protein [Nitrosophilus kaiyonis]